MTRRSKAPRASGALQNLRAGFDRHHAAENPHGNIPHGDKELLHE